MSKVAGDASFCKSCGADIVWLNTATGKPMPVDADSVDPGETEYEHGKHISHFATCPQANEWRKKGYR